jgi:predicted acylesterase/phospholipase RssA
VGDGNVHLVLSSGGVRCLAYVGAVQALEAADVKVEGVAACSAGTIVGALLAAGVSGDEMENAVLHADLARLARAWGARLERIKALYRWPFEPETSLGLAEFVGDIIGHDRTFAQLERPFATVGIDVVTGDFLVYTRDTHPEMRVVDAIGIATALPFVSRPHRSGHRQVVDAAIASRSPVWLAAAFDEKLPIVLLRSAPITEILTPRNPINYIRRIVDAAVGGRDALLIRGDPRVRTVDLPTAGIAYHRFDLDAAERARLIRVGRTATERVIDEADGDFAASALRVTNAAARLPGGHDEETARRYDEVAAWAGAHYAQRFIDAPPREIFISYAHEDREWLERVLRYLRPELSAGQVTIWSDQEIAAGDRWRREIEQAIGRARVALLLVTPALLGSQFVAENELPALISATKHRGTVLMWAHVRPATYQATFATWQAAYDPEPALEELDEAARQTALLTIARTVARAFD